MWWDTVFVMSILIKLLKYKFTLPVFFNLICKFNFKTFSFSQHKLIDLTFGLLKNYALSCVISLIEAQLGKVIS